MNPNTFLLQAIKHPLSVGAIAPSSQSLSNLMLEHAELHAARAVAELGPGTGSFTRKIIDQLAADVAYLGIERNESFASKLVEQYSEERIALGSAEELTHLLADRGVTDCNRIISGLPWMAFAEERQDKILSEVAKNLTDDGLFLTYAYFPFNLFSKGQHFHTKLKQNFKQVNKTATVLNVPPAFVYICSQPIKPIT